VKTAPEQNMVTLTSSAADQVRSMLEAQPENAGKPLRVYVEGGGCSGMQYGMVFDEPRVRVVVDEVSADYLKGAVIDFSEALTGGGFKITNPNAKSSCGCGKSFEA
jgi:iron-sulfur cluster assembly accessory protein